MTVYCCVVQLRNDVFGELVNADQVAGVKVRSLVLTIFSRMNWLSNSASFFVKGFRSLSDSFSLFVGLDRAHNTKGIEKRTNN